MKKLTLPIFIFTLSTVIGLQAQVNYVQMAKPFSSNPAFLAPKGPVSSTAIQVPVITWAADGTTVAANDGMTRSATSKLAVALGTATSIALQDDFEKQVADYISGKSPFLRGTLGMINLAAEGLAEKDAGLEPVVFYQLSWSTGADGFVGRNVRKVNELKGKTIVVQKNGPHIDLVRTLLQSAGLKSGEVTIKYVRDIMDIGEGGGVNDPAGAMRRDPSVAGAACIYPDIMALTRDGKVGDGTQGSVIGARPILTTKDASRVIADVYAVRRDWFESNGGKVAKMREVLLAEQERFQKELKKPSAAFRSECRSLAKIFLGDEKLVEDYLAWAGSDSQLAGKDGNFEFFERPGWSAGFARTNEKIQEYYLQEGFIRRSMKLSDGFAAGTAGTGGANPVIDSPEFPDNPIEILEVNFPFPSNIREIRWQDNESLFEQLSDMHQAFGGGGIGVYGYADPTLYNLVKQAEASGRNTIKHPNNGKIYPLNQFGSSKSIETAAIKLTRDRAWGIKAAYKEFVKHKTGKPMRDEETENMKFEGKGFEDPLFPDSQNVTKEEMGKNRRVKAIVYGQKTQVEF